MKNYLPHGRPYRPPVLILILLLSSLASWAQSPGGQNGLAVESQRAPGFIEYAWQLVVWQKDGSKVLFSLDSTPTIKHDGEKVIIQSKSTVEYDFQAIKKMTYSLEEVDGINDLIVREEIPFTNSGGVITFLPSEKDLHVKIVLINGMVVKDFIVRKGEASSIPLEYSPGNLYLIHVNGVTYKIKI